MTTDPLQQAVTALKARRRESGTMIVQSFHIQVLLVCGATKIFIVLLRYLILNLTRKLSSKKCEHIWRTNIILIQLMQLR